MDKGKGKEVESSNEQFDLKRFPVDGKDDDNFPQSSRVKEELGLKNKEVVKAVTDNLDQNPDVKSGNLISGQTGSSSLGAMPLTTNDSAQQRADAPVAVFKHLNLPLYGHNMRVLSSHDTYREMRPPRVKMGPPMVQMRPPRVKMRPPTVQRRPPVGQMPPPMRPFTNSNTAVRAVGEQGGRVGEASNSGELGSDQDKSQQNDEDGSTSRDAKRSRK